MATKQNTNIANFKGTGKAGIIDKELYLRAGIDPNTRLPTRRGGNLLEELTRVIRIIDEQDAVNRFEWEGLPTSINGQELERLLYYKGQLLFFKFQDKYYFMPYALDGSIDFYARFNRVHPIPMTSGKEEEEKKPSYKNQLSLLSTLKIMPIYDINEIEEGIDYSANASSETSAYGVIIRDYTNQLSQEIIPRWQLNDCLCRLEAECMCYLNTAMMIGSGISGVRVPDTDSMEAVLEGALGLKQYAINGVAWVPIKGAIDFQELTNGTREGMSDYFLTMQSLDNFRLSTYGLENTGVFEKQSHILNDENQINQQKNQLVKEDSLKIRERFCEIANKLFGLNISVKNSEVMAETLGGEIKPKDSYTRIANYGGEDNGNEDNA